MKPVKIRFVIAVIALCGMFGAHAQQDPLYTQYMFNMLAVNPAYAGSRDVISLTALYRNQWSGINGAPRSFTFSGDAPLWQEKLGVGVQVTRDQIGLSDNTKFIGSLTYRLRIKKSTLAFGMNGGLQNYRFNGSGATLQNEDASFANQQRLLPVIGAGVYFNSDKFYFGVSLPQMITNTLVQAQPNVINGVRASQFRHMFLMAGYVFSLNKDVKLKPSVLWKFVSGAPSQVDVNLNAWFYDIFGLGVSYRTLDAVSVLVELQATDQIRIGYAYDRPLTSISNYTFGSHELMLRYEMGYNKSKVISPRYF